uniref:DNA-packaging protein n=1 Tax=Nitratireductor aestuarii TaxID=1735103 RepID=UPI0035A244B5
MAAQVLDEWVGTSRLAQYPAGMGLRDIWLVLGGRGAGKTRLGAEWVNALVNGFRPFADHRYGRIALVGETLNDVREVMVEGPSGILSTARRNRPQYEPSRRRLVWENGAVAQIFSATEPDSLRGPQFDAAWSDEVAKWKDADACFDMLQFGLRLGTRPIQILTTTPRPIGLIRHLLGSEQVTVTRMKTADNSGNLSASFIEAVEQRYGGTALGRQELDGEIIEDRQGALWTRAQIDEAGRVQADYHAMRRIVIAVDPPASSRKSSDACGIIVAGIDQGDVAWVLQDATAQGLKPQDWARQVVSLYHRFEADMVVAEVNQGGDMVASVLATADASVPVTPVRATRGKWTRAEPVAALYAQGRVRHAGRFPELEDEMCNFGPDGLSEGHSPDRVDALVWAISSLILRGDAEPKIRHLA